MDRRSVIQSLLSLVAALRYGWVRLRAQPAQAPTLSSAHLATLRAVAAAVLPAALGRDGVENVVERFRRWHHEYRAGADMDHGYGFTRLRSTPPAPGAGYGVQLEALERAARGRGRPFAKLDSAMKRALIESAVEAANVGELPPRPNGRHVATDLMGFYFFSTDANDLCYGAAIGRDRCRALEGSGERPEPFQPRAD